jgi:predicted nucleotidyltransferase
MNSDFKDLLRLLSEKKAEFLVIGGYAVIHYAEPRYTKDLDLLIGTDAENAEKVLEALREFGAPVNTITPRDLCTPEVFFQIGVPPNRIDMIVTVPGVEFKAAYARRGSMAIGDMQVPVISRDDLIRAKLMAGRPQDLVDAGLLARAGK